MTQCTQARHTSWLSLAYLVRILDRNSNLAIGGGVLFYIMCADGF